MTTTVLAGCLIAATAGAATSDRWNLPVATKKLDNGLTVVVSEDHSSPTIGVSVVYRVGIRTEPRGRTGFAHLFEHLMFEGTPAAPHGVFDHVTADGGGDNNGSTHPDFTSYVARAPVSALEPLLWLEADRMKTLAFSQDSLDGQRDVVKEEIRVNVLNQPYGGFAETDLPQLAFAKWENGHDGYGSFDDLDKAGLDDVRGFHRDYYGPNNAVLGIAGDVTPEQGFALAKKYFGAISPRATPPRPDVDELLNTAEKRIVQGDGLAKLPALAVGWKMPPRGSRDQAAMVVLGELLAGGDASRLYQALVKGNALAVQVGDFTGSGSPWEYDGPTLYTVTAVYKADAKADALLAAIDAQVQRIEKEGVDPATLEGIKTRMLSGWYDDLEPFMDRAEMLAILQSVWGDAKVANQVPDLIDGVTSADIQRVASTYLTRANRSIIDRRPDFMLPPGDPARSDVRAKAAPRKKPAPSGSVSVGGLQPVKTPQGSGQPAPAAGAAPVSPPPTQPPSPKPEATKPDATKPEATKPEATKPEATKPEATKPEATKPEATKPAQPAPLVIPAIKPEAVKGSPNPAAAPGKMPPATPSDAPATPTSAHPGDGQQPATTAARANPAPSPASPHGPGAADAGKGNTLLPASTPPPKPKAEARKPASALPSSPATTPAALPKATSPTPAPASSSPRSTQPDKSGAQPPQRSAASPAKVDAAPSLKSDGASPGSSGKDGASPASPAGDASGSHG